MANDVLTTADMARIVRQIIGSEEREIVETREPRFAFSDCYSVVWQGNQIHYCNRVERGMVNCPVCGVLVGMGDLILSRRETEVELRHEHLHVLEVHAGRVRGEKILDIDRLRKVLGVEGVPLVDQGDGGLQKVLMALWEIQNAVISQYYVYSPDMHKERRKGYITTWRGRTIRVWFSPGKRRGNVCPLCGDRDWENALEISLAEGETRVYIPPPARHLMEAHRLTEVPDWQVWNHPGDFEILMDFLGFEK
jgi:hypothetical protein